MQRQPLRPGNAAEEIEDLGRSDRDTLRGAVRRITEHFLKLHCSPATDPRDNLTVSIVGARAELEKRLSATLRRDLEDSLPCLYRRRAELDLRRHTGRATNP